MVLLLWQQLVRAQESDGYGVNLRHYYAGKVHFGFALCANFSDLRINPVRNSQLPDTVIGASRYQVQTVHSIPVNGFGIGLVTDFRLSEYLRLRICPKVSFATRRIRYGLVSPDGDSSRIYEKTVESVCLVFPAELKIQSKRQGNFSAYVIGGGGYSLDLSARKKAGGSGAEGFSLDDNVKLLRDDFFYSAGAGVDFYLNYFKLGFELKLQVGTRNLLKKENSVFTNSVDKIRSRMVVFSITFEGG